MASTEPEVPSQSLRNKTSVLRVSIHCQGCKRKVQKLLQSVPGVEEIQIEPKLQRVVVTGDVSPETLLIKLVKAGKHAELWPEKPPEINPIKEPEKPPVSEQLTETKPPTSKSENPVEDPARVNKAAAPGGGEPVVTGGNGEGDKVKAEEKKPETGSTGDQASQAPVEEKTEKDGGGGGGGEGKKKKKKKAQNSGDKNGGSTSGPPPPTIGRSVNGGGGPQPTRPTNQSPPRHYNGYEYPPRHYYTPPPAPVYTVSYNTAQPPVNSYTASYYAPPPPQSYAYSHFGSEMAAPPAQAQAPYVSSGYDDSYRQQPSDSFEMFSDENPNGCLVM